MALTTRVIYIGCALALTAAGCSAFLNGKSSDPGAPQGASWDETKAAWDKALSPPRDPPTDTTIRPISPCELERGRFREAHPEPGAELPPALACLPDGSYPPPSAPSAPPAPPAPP